MKAHYSHICKNLTISFYCSSRVPNNLKFHFSEDTSKFCRKKENFYDTCNEMKEGTNTNDFHDSYPRHRFIYRYI